MNEHDFEPVKGLPADLPKGEAILWQGAPDWKSLARRALRVRVLLFYFGLLAVWDVSGGIESNTPALDIAQSTAILCGLGAIAIVVMALFAWLVARTTVYTITSRRVVIRFGIAFPITLQVAFPMIDGAGLHAWSNGSGDIALKLRPGQKISYLIVWPHVRPWKLSRAEPTLRCVTDAASVAQILGRALAASASQAAQPVSVSAAAAAGSLHVPAAA